MKFWLNITLAELPSLQHDLYYLGNTGADIELLVQAFTILSRENRGSSSVASASGCQSDPNLYLFEFNFPHQCLLFPNRNTNKTAAITLVLS